MMATAQSTTDNGCRPRRMQNFLLVWVDGNVNSDDPDTKNTLEQLRGVVNNVSLVRRPSDCVRFLREVKTEKCFVISSGALGQELVPKISSMANLDAIFIFCGNKKFHEQWSKEWNKVKGVYTEIGPVCEALQMTTKQCNNDDIAVSFINVDDDSSSTDLNRLEPSFMYATLLKGTILDMEHEQEEITKLVTYCRVKFQGNPADLEVLDEFGREYRPHQAVWWYTRECFLYQTLNRALRLLEGDIIIDMGFFINDLHRQLKELHDKQIHQYGGKSYTVYRGQGFSEENFAKLQKNKGGLMGFNCFLSTSKKPELSVQFAQNGAKKEKQVGILFVMTIDPNLNCTPFADVEHINYFKEPEILFSMHTVFRIGQIKAMKEQHNLYEVQLALTGDDDPQLTGLTAHLEEEYSGSGWPRLAYILHQMGQQGKAQEIYLTLLEKETNECNKGSHNLHLGQINDREGNYLEAIRYYERALTIFKRLLAANDPTLATTYNGLGEVYDSMGEYSKALYYYEQALNIRKKSLPENHSHLAQSYNNIGVVYSRLRQYSKALSNHEQALAIRKKTLPENHQSLAQSYNNIACPYLNMENYSKALSYYEEALAIWEKALPENHPEFAISYNNIAFVYENMKDYSKALTLFEKALHIREKSLPPGHPDIAEVRESIEIVKKQCDSISK